MINIEDVISVVKIQETYFYINEKLAKPNIAPIVTINQESSYYLEENLYSLSIICSYNFENSEEPFLKIRVQNVFRIEGLNTTFFDKEINKIKIPEIFMLTVLGIAINHTRAILSIHTKGTHFQELFITVVDLRKVATVIFPEFFQEEQSISNKETETATI